MTALLATRVIDHDRGLGLHRGADVPGAIVITGALMLLVYTIVVSAAQHGWGAPETLVLGALSLALTGVFILREARSKTPLMPLRVFRSRTLTGANMIQTLLPAGTYGMFFLGALYLQRVLGYDALQIGLVFLPFTVVQGTLSVRYTDPLIARVGARRLIVTGILPLTAGLVLLTRAGTHASYPLDLLPAMVLVGVGGGLCFPAIMTLAMSEATPDDAGLASGLINTSTQIGGALGLAVLAMLSTERTAALRVAGVSLPDALTQGYHLAFWIAVGFLAVAMVLALTVLTPKRNAVTADDADDVPIGPTDKPVQVTANASARL